MAKDTRIGNEDGVGNNAETFSDYSDHVINQSESVCMCACVYGDNTGDE